MNDRLNPLLNAVISANYDLALERARTLDAEGQRRVFEGLPFLIKDLTDVAGFQTLNGSRLFRGYVATENNPFVQATEDAGAVVLGKTATPEFGLIGTTEPLATAIPWATR